MLNKTTLHQKSILLLILCCMLYGKIYTQSAKLELVATNGGVSVTPYMSVSWSIGQISTSTASGGPIIITPGYQQSFPSFLAKPGVILDFRINKLEMAVELDWQTHWGSRISGFTIEWSVDCLNWEPISYIKGRGQDDAYLKYLFVDSRPKNGYNYYRLRLEDQDEGSQISEVQYVIFDKDSAAKTTIYPNPNCGRFTLRIDNPAGERAALEIFSSRGNLVWEQYFEEGKMPEVWKMELNLEPGQMYYVVSRIGKGMSTQKMAIIEGY